MGVTVRCQIFSGRRDPAWTLSSTQVTELRAMIDALTGRTLLKPPAVAGALGYRGFLIHSNDVEEELTPESLVIVHAGIIDRQRIALNLVDEKNGVERWLLDSGGSVIDPDLKTRIGKEMLLMPPVLPPGWKATR
jgi:hypothetical protein